MLWSRPSQWQSWVTLPLADNIFIYLLTYFSLQNKNKACIQVYTFIIAYKFLSKYLYALAYHHIIVMYFSSGWVWNWKDWKDLMFMWQLWIYALITLTWFKVGGHLALEPQTKVKRKIAKISQSLRRPLLGSFPGLKSLLQVVHLHTTILRHYAKQALTWVPDTKIIRVWQVG